MDVGQAHDHDYAGWWARVGAYLIDSILLTIVIAIVAGIIAAVAGGSGAFVVIFVILALVGYVGYFTWMEGSDSGQTIGKRAVGIRVRSDEGERASYGQAFGRNIVGRLLGWLPLVGLLDVLWPLWDDHKQCLHDKAASTVVVRA